MEGLDGGCGGLRWWVWRAEMEGLDGGLRWWVWRA